MFVFFGICGATVDMSVPLPSGKLLEIQQLFHALLPRLPVTVHQVMLVLSKTTFYASGYAQPCWLYQVIHSDMLNVYHSPADFFLSSFLSSMA